MVKEQVPCGPGSFGPRVMRVLVSPDPALVVGHTRKQVSVHTQGCTGVSTTETERETVYRGREPGGTSDRGGPAAEQLDGAAAHVPGASVPHGACV